MSNPSPPSGHPQGEDMRPNVTWSSNAHGGHNICCRNQNQHQGGSRSSYEGNQAEIKDHVYDVGGIQGGVVGRIEASHDWSTIHQQHDLIELLTLIRRSLYTSATTRNPAHALWDAYSHYQSFWQGTWMRSSNYLREFKALVTTV